MDDLELERRRADGAVPGDDGHRRSRDARLRRRRDRLLGCRRRRSHGRGALGHAGGRLAVPVVAERRHRLQAADADDLGSGRWRHGLVPGQPGHRVLLRLPLRRVPNGRWERLDDAAGSQRPHIAGVRCVPVHHRDQPVPPPLPDPGRGRSRRPGHARRRRATAANRPARAALERRQRHGRRLGDLDRPAGRRGRRAATGRAVDHLRERRIRPGPRRDPRPGRRLDGRGLDRLRGRRQPARRVDHAGGAGPEPAQPEHLDHLGLRAPRPGAGRGRAAVVRPAAGDHRLGGGTCSVRIRGRHRAASSRRGPSGSPSRTRRDRSTRHSSSARTATTSSSSTSSPTSGSATSSRSTRGTRPG